MIAKFNVMSVEGSTEQGYNTVCMAPVCGNKPFGPNGENEDNDFARWSPSGSLSLTITNPNLMGKFFTGQTFYLNFSEVVPVTAPADPVLATPAPVADPVLPTPAPAPDLEPPPTV